MTDSTFPVNLGTEISVTCSADHLHSGSSVITCIKETNFAFTEEPQCTYIGKFDRGLTFPANSCGFLLV